MLQKNPKSGDHNDLFRSRLENMIDMRHELVKLENLIDWEGLTLSFCDYYCDDNGRPAESIRLMTGLVFLKEYSGLSDDDICKAWSENPYYQYFCGEEFFQHRLPVEQPSIGNFRRRIGKAGMERLLQETILLALKTKVINKRDLKLVSVDTTVQEKAVHFPTDSRLCDKARQELVKQARKEGIKLRQTYARKGRNAMFMANRYMAARQGNRARKKIKEVKNYLGRVIRDINRGLEKAPDLMPVFRENLTKAEVIFNQTLVPKSKEKIFSWHAPEVECIAKGKAHKKYEFGCKSSYAATNKSNFIIGAMALHGRPYDGHTLRDVLKQINRLTGIIPQEIHADLGYRGHKIKDKNIHVILSRHKRGITPAKRKRQKRRNAIEPIIGHLKNDRKIGPRNWLKGKIGDQINAIAIAIGFNIRKILKKLFLRLIYGLVLLQKFKINRLKQPENALFYA